MYLCRAHTNSILLCTRDLCARLLSCARMNKYLNYRPGVRARTLLACRVRASPSASNHASARACCHRLRAACVHTSQARVDVLTYVFNRTLTLSYKAHARGTPHMMLLMMFAILVLYYICYIHMHYAAVDTAYGTHTQKIC